MTSKLELSSNEIDGLIRLTKKRKANEPDLSNVHDFFTKRQRVELSEIERKTIFDFAHLQAGDATITKLRNVLRPKKETDLTQSDVDKILEILDERKEKDSKYKEVYDILSKKQKDGSFTVEYNEEDPNIEFLQPKGSRRYVLYDLQHSELFKYAKKLQDLHWTTNASDVDLSSDTAHFEEIKNKRPEVADVTLGVLSFFAASDGIIMENIESFTEDIGIIEMKSFYAVQGANEFVHSEMYSKLIQAYEKREEERKKLFSAIENNEGVRRKAEWTKKWLDKSNPIAVRIIANAITEGIFFLSAFSWIFWLTTAFPGKVPGLIKSNEWTSRDENLHTEAGISLHNSLPHRADPKIIKEMLTSAYETELFFVRNLFPTRVAGFNVARLEEHIRYMVNHWWALLEEPLQKKQGPLLFNDDGTIPRPTDEAPKIYQFVKINFFEVKGTYEAAKYLDQQTADISADF